MADKWWSSFPDIEAKSGDNWWDSFPDAGRKPPTPAAKPEAPKETIGPWRAGLVGTTADVMRATARGLYAANMPEWGADVEKGAQERYKTAEGYQPEVPSYQDIYKEGDLLGSAKRLGQYGYESFAQSAPAMAGLAATGIAGALAAPEAAAVGVGGALAGAIGRTGVTRLAASQLGRSAIGMGAAATADVPQFVGQNLTEQMDGGKKTLPETSLGTALAGAGPQALLDVALGEVLPGVGRAAGGSMLVRFAKKALEGGLIEGVSEGLQQAIQVGQADPRKLWDFDPETQKGIFDAAIRGGLMGGAVGGVSGAVQRKPGIEGMPVPTMDQGDTGQTPQSPGYGLPPGGPDYIGQPRLEYQIPGQTPWNDRNQQPPLLLEDQRGNRTAPRSVPDMVREQEGWQAQQALGSPAMPPQTQVTPRTQPLEGMTEDQITQQALSPSAPAPNPGRMGPGPDWISAPVGPTSPVQAVQEAQQALDQLQAVVPTMAAKRGGEAVYADIKAKLQAMGMRAGEANTNAAIVRAFYERLGTRLGQDPMDLWKQRNVQVTGGNLTLGTPNKSFAQRVFQGSPDDAPFAKYDSKYLGTGEGAMAYGHGHYFTDDKEMAENYYRKRLAQQNVVSFDGKPATWNPDTMRWSIAGKERDFGHSEVLDLLKDTPSPEFLAEQLEAERAYHTREYDFGGGDEDSRAMHLDEANDRSDKLNILNKLMSEHKVEVKRRGETGRLYHVDIPDEGYLHYDRPVREQPHILRVLRDNLVGGVDFPTKKSVSDYFGARNVTGGTAYDMLADTLGGHEQTSALLHSVGIPGIQFYSGKHREQARRADAARRLAKDLRVDLRDYEKMIKDVESGTTHFTSSKNPVEAKRDALNGLRKELGDIRAKLTTADHIASFKPSQNYVIFNDETPKIAHYEQSRTGKGKPDRAGIDFSPNGTMVKLLSTADKSSFMHEMGHLFLEELIKHAPNSPQVAHDLKVMMDWLGLKKAADIKEVHHEKFARAFERYLMEGKAPTPGLKGVFERFAQWLGQIYGTALKLKVPMNDAVRGVFGRILGGEELAPTTAAPTSAPPGRSTSREFKPGRMPKMDRETFSQGPTKSFNQPAVDAQSNLIGRAWGTAKAFAKGLYYLDRTLHPMGWLPNLHDLIEKRQLTSGEVGKWAERGKQAFKLFQKVTPTQADDLHAFFTTKNADPAPLAGELREQAVQIKQWIEELGDQLVQRGVLTRETYEENKGAYLPNIYAKHIMEHKGITTAGMRVNASELKKRHGLTDEEMVALGKITHPSVTTQVALMRLGRDVAMLDYLKGLMPNHEWVHARSAISYDGQRVTPEWLVAEAQGIRERARVVEQTGNRAMAEQARAKAAQMQEAGEQAQRDRGQEPIDPKQWKQLPNTIQYGMLRGAWVRNEIADDISGAVDYSTQTSTMAKLLGDKNSWMVKAVQLWKLSKVPFSPGAQSRNFVGNVMQANLFGGVPWRRMAQGVTATVNDMRANGQYTQLAAKYGLPHSTMGEVELHELAKIITKGLAEGHGPVGLMKMFSLFHGSATKVSNLYQASESLFKTMVMRDAMLHRGLSERDAARMADEAIYDYTLVHPSIKWMRNSALGMPFITWQYKTVGALARTMREHPFRFTPFVAFMAAAPYVTASIMGLEGDDPERLRKAMAEGLRRQHNMYLLPFKDANGRWAFVDLGYFFPWQMPQDVIQGTAEGHFGDAFKALNLFSHPAVNAIIATTTGIDPFTQRPIADKRDPTDKQALDIVGYVWSLAMPSVLADYGAAGKLYQKLNGTGMNRYGEPTNTTGEIVARLFGINTYPIDPDAQRARNLIHMNSEIQQVKSRMTYATRDKSLTPDQRNDLRKDYQSKVRDMQKEMITYGRDTAMTPSLRAATARP